MVKVKVKEILVVAKKIKWKNCQTVYFPNFDSKPFSLIYSFGAQKWKGVCHCVVNNRDLLVFFQASRQLRSFAAHSRPLIHTRSWWSVIRSTEIHPSMLSRLSRTGAVGLQGVFLVSFSLPRRPWDALRPGGMCNPSGHSWCCLRASRPSGHAWNASKGKRPDQMPEPPRLARLNVNKQKLHSGLPLGVWAPSR